MYYLFKILLTIIGYKEILCFNIDNQVSGNYDI